MPKKKKRSDISESYSIANLLKTPAVADPMEDKAETLPDLMDDDEDKLARFFEFLASKSLATHDDAAIAHGVAAIQNSQMEEVAGSASLPDWEETVLPQPFAGSAAEISTFTAPLVAPLKETLASVIASSSVAVEPDDHATGFTSSDLQNTATPSKPTISSNARRIKLVLRHVENHETAKSLSASSPASAVTLPASPVLRLRIPIIPISASHAEEDISTFAGVKRTRAEAGIVEDFDSALVNTWLTQLRSYGFTDAEIDTLHKHPLGSKNILTIAKTYGWLTKSGFDHEQIYALGAEVGPKAVMMIILRWDELKEFFTHAQIIKIMNHPVSINEIDKVIDFAKKSVSDSGAANTSLAFAASERGGMDLASVHEN